TVLVLSIDLSYLIVDDYFHFFFILLLVGLFSRVYLYVSYRQTLEIIIFSLESHISLLKELLLDDAFYVKVHIYDYDTKRLHLFLTMYNGKDERVATYEVIMIGVSRVTRRSMSLPQAILEKIE